MRTQTRTHRLCRWTVSAFGLCAQNNFLSRFFVDANMYKWLRVRNTSQEGHWNIICVSFSKLYSSFLVFLFNFISLRRFRGCIPSCKDPPHALTAQVSTQSAVEVFLFFCSIKNSLEIIRLLNFLRAPFVHRLVQSVKARFLGCRQDLGCLGKLRSAGVFHLGTLVILLEKALSVCLCHRAWK